MEGVVKGGYPVDISSQPPADLTCIVQPDCASSLLESGLEPAAVAQFEAGYSYSREMHSPPSISEVIQPMEIAELVDILPTLSLIEEEYAAAPPPSPSVMDMLENFGLGIGETNASFDFGGSNLTSGVETPQTPRENVLSGQEAASVCNSVHSGDDEALALSCDADKLEMESRGPHLPVRSLVEWEKPTSSSSH